MTVVLEIDGKSLLPIKEVVKQVSYSRDYITRLAREGKIVASHVGRKWYVDIDSLNSYTESVSLEKEVRKKLLSEERKREQRSKIAVSEQHTLRIKQAENFHTKAMVATSLVLSFGLLSGFGMQQFLNSSQNFSLGQSQAKNVAQVSDSISTGPALGVESAKELTEAVIDPKNKSAESDGIVNNVTTMGEVKNGIVLFPTATSGVMVKDLFSDNVTLEKTKDGTQAVVQVDNEGNKIGNEIPFINIPVDIEIKSESI